MRVLTATTIVAATAGCFRVSDSEPDSIPIARSFAAVDLISPATCQNKLGKLRQCVIATSVHEAPPIDSAVPLRTAIRRQMAGNCSTPYALTVAIAVDDQPAVNLPFLSQAELILRRPDGGPLGAVTVSDASPWTSVATFADSCSVLLTLSVNELDVDTVQQAQAILAAIDLELAEAQRDVRNYEALLALQAAYAFTHAVATSFHQELTNETMQQLRAAAIDAAPAMELAALGCSETLADDQRNALFQLYVSLVALGDPAAWQNPDGTTKTLAHFYGADAATVLAQLQALASQASPDLETQYRAGLEAATTERVRLEQKRALAVEQLAPWLGGTP